MIITIDGPAGSGKSTVARRLAERLGFQFLNTGAMYRAIALKCVRAATNLEDFDAVADCARNVRITFEEDRPHLDGEDVSDALRTELVSTAASRVAVNPQVRELLVSLQRVAAEGRKVVTEGRDQGTIVFPDAALKIFLTANPETRAARRYAELAAIEGAPPDDITYANVLAQIRDRDERDLNRSIAPLKPAPDAIVFDTSEITIDDAVAHLERLVRERTQTVAHTT